MTALSAEDLATEIKKNDELIIQNIGKPATTFCFPYNAYNETVVAAVMEGRIGARLKEFWLGGQNSPKEYLHKQVEGALEAGSWITGMTHGINYGYDCYEDATEFTDFLDYLKTLEERIWVGTFREVAAYMAERDAVRLKQRVKGRRISVTPSLDLDPELYNMPLTMKVEGVTEVQAKQSGKKLTVVYRDGCAFFDFDPYGGAVKLQVVR
jgi:hypothetical protein